MNMKVQSTFSAWKELITLISFPLVYMLYIASPFAMSVFSDKDVNNYIPVWSGIIILHWLSIYLIYLLLKKQNKTFRDIGYKLSKKGTFILTVCFFLISLLVLGLTETVIEGSIIDKSNLTKLPSLIPTTTTHRFFFIFLVFSTGFCEEIVYRGFALNVLQKIGLNKWISIFIAAFIFIGIHGFHAYTNRFIFLITGGVVFGLIYILSKRLLPSIIIHLIFNLLSMMVILELIE